MNNNRHTCIIYSPVYLFSIEMMIVGGTLSSGYIWTRQLKKASVNSFSYTTATRKSIRNTLTYQFTCTNVPSDARMYVTSARVSISTLLHE